MIIYRHHTEIEAPEIAKRDARPGTLSAICHQGHQEWIYSGVCDPLFWSIPEQADWKDIADGWQVAECGEAEWNAALELSRMDFWAKCIVVTDARGRTWRAPVILLPGDLGRAYPVAYAGSDFLPAPTKDQQVAEQIASEARAALSAAAAGGQGLPVRVACQWTARLLSLSHHVSSATLAQLGMIDGELVQQVLTVASGLDPRLDPSHAS